MCRTTVANPMMNEPWQRLPALSLKQLQYFVTLAQLRHFTDTASRLAISQPALSSALRQIGNGTRRQTGQPYRCDGHSD
ncbi:LysR family transcriptional regulator [Klebsiella pneumoniae subsp. pneumoniae]|nr:LysR family transcriptional regulator [Klebsiella pneumoniae subsp. pneumoniae]